MGKSWKEIGKMIMPVLLGTITAIIIFVALDILSLVVAGAIPFGGSFIKVSIIVLLSIFLSSFIGGYVTGLFFEKRYGLYSSITGLILTIIYFFSDDFKLNDKTFYVIALILITPFTLAGAYCANRKTLQPDKTVD